MGEQYVWIFWPYGEHVAAYDSSYNQHQHGLYTSLNSWVVVRTI
jgi:hypothetical protein